MHFEILVEDVSGKTALDILVPKILAPDDTCKIRSYKGVGRLPKDLRTGKTAPAKRILLDRLPKLLQGYGRAFSGSPDGYMIIVVCDLDDKKESVFRRELQGVLDKCNPKPDARFCLAIEEGEAWILGDEPAILKAYPKAKKAVLREYENDSICGTWECLADAVHPGGAAKLTQEGGQAVGREKSRWAENICPHMNIENNKSPSFNHFVHAIKTVNRG